jgi:hypothetical protein
MGDKRTSRKNQTGLPHLLLRLNGEVPLAWSPFLLSVDYKKKMSERWGGKYSNPNRRQETRGEGREKDDGIPGAPSRAPL